MATPTGFITEAARQTPVKAETEVLVIGGGTAGVSAAVAAARSGADVILVERLGYLGGLAQSTGDAALLLDAAGKDMILVETVGVGQDEIWDSVSVPTPMPEDFDQRLRSIPSVDIDTVEDSASKSQLGSLRWSISSSSTSSGTSGTEWR